MKRARRWLFLSMLGTASLHAGQAPPQAIMEKLAGDEFRQREQAQAELQKWADLNPAAAKDFLFHAMESAGDPEVRMRCRAVLKSQVIHDYLKAGDGFMGLTMREAQIQVPGDANVRFGVVITSLAARGPAHQAGLRFGDQIVAFNGEVWREAGANMKFSQLTRAAKPGTKVALQVVRAGQLLKLNVTLMRMPGMPISGVNDWNDLQRLDDQAKESFFSDWLNKRRAARR